MYYSVPLMSRVKVLRTHLVRLFLGDERSDDLHEWLETIPALVEMFE
jgi:hypothetical protein